VAAFRKAPEITSAVREMVARSMQAQPAAFTTAPPPCPGHRGRAGKSDRQAGTNRPVVE
jgi:hypothetical protein